jgi:hypothetical protein
MALSVDSAPHCERDDDPENCEIEITPKMIEAGVAILFDTPGLAPCGVDFDGAVLVMKIYMAMASRR